MVPLGSRQCTLDYPAAAQEQKFYQIGKLSAAQYLYTLAKFAMGILYSINMGKERGCSH